MQKISSFHLFILEIQSILTNLATSIYDHTQPEIFNQALIYVNLYHYAKNQAILLICSGNIVD